MHARSVDGSVPDHNPWTQKKATSPTMNGEVCRQNGTHATGRQVCWRVGAAANSQCDYPDHVECSKEEKDQRIPLERADNVCDHSLKRHRQPGRSVQVALRGEVHNGPSGQCTVVPSASDSGGCVCEAAIGGHSAHAWRRKGPSTASEVGTHHCLGRKGDMIYRTHHKQIWSTNGTTRKAIHAQLIVL